MVATRRQRALAGQPLARMNNEIGRRRRQQQAVRTYIKQYRDRDWAHRHRLDDDQEKEEVVRAYTRRKA